MVISSVASGHTPLLVVQRRVTALPTATPVTVVFGEAALVIEAEPLMIVQLPLPAAGVLAAILNEEVLQIVWSGPAEAVV